MKVPRDAPSGTGPVRYGNLLDDDGALHAGALVGLAVVAVGAGGVELVGHLLAGAVEVILVGDGVGVDAGGDVVLVEDDVVGERLVVDELDGLALGDGDLVGLFVSGKRRGGKSQESSLVNRAEAVVGFPIGSFGFVTLKMTWQGFPN